MEWKSTNFRVASQLLPSSPPPHSKPHYSLRICLPSPATETAVRLRRRLQSDHVLREPAQGARWTVSQDSRVLPLPVSKKEGEDKRTDGRRRGRSVAAVEAALHF